MKKLVACLLLLFVTTLFIGGCTPKTPAKKPGTTPPTSTPGTPGGAGGTGDAGGAGGAGDAGAAGGSGY